MTGSEGELFGPMAMTYAFALGGALLMALSLTPVLCVLLFTNLKPIQDNFLVRFLKSNYLRILQSCLKHRWTTIALMGALLLVTMLWPMRDLGREFMPELEEGNLWIRATFPVHVSLDGVSGPVRQARH